MCSALADVLGPKVDIDETARQFMAVEPYRTDVATFLFWRLLHLGEYFIQVEAGRFLSLWIVPECREELCHVVLSGH